MSSASEKSLPKLSVPSRLLDSLEARKRSGLGRSAMFALIARNKYPRPVKVGRKSVFVEREVELWIQSRIDERDLKSGSAR